MGNLIDKICKCRDILTQSPEKLRHYIGTKGLFDSTLEDIHSQIKRKASDYSRELEFTSQDLMEFIFDVQRVLKKWETELCPKRNIKQLLKTVKDGTICLDDFTDAKTEIMALRTDCIEMLTKVLSLLEYHSVFLYFLEESSRDEFALKMTKRYN